MPENALIGLMNPATVGKSVMDGFENVRKVREEVDGRNALMRYARDPSEANALALLPYKPDVALKLQEQGRERRFNDAAARYATRPNPPTIASAGMASPPNAPANTPRDPSGQPLQGADPMHAAADQPPANPDYRVLGQPQTQADADFLQMLQIDAKKAFGIDSEMRDRAADRLKLQRDAYGQAVSRFAGVNDEQSYQAALAQIASQIEPLGVEITDHLPPHFPGADGIRQLRLGALDAKDQLSYFLRETNMEADNNRADRNTDSLIADREARRAEDRRYHDVRAGNARRGQDMASSDRRRGQDLRPRGGGGRESIVSVQTPAEAMKLAPGSKYRSPDGVVRIR